MCIFLQPSDIIHQTSLASFKKKCKFKRTSGTRRSSVPDVLSNYLLSRQCPAIEQGNPIQSFCATFLDAHRSAQLHPAGGLIRRDAQGLVSSDASVPAHILNVPLRVVLIRRRPPVDNRPDGIESVIMVVCACQQLKGCTPAIRHCFKLTELRVCLQRLHALPIRL